MKPSFIREILKVVNSDTIISFAGGLPDPNFFPTKEIQEASMYVSQDKTSMQYSNTEGDSELRRYILNRYYKNCDFNEDNILITNGSQQALDLLGKLFIDNDDGVVIESPGYLGAIQAFSVYQPNFYAIELMEDGMQVEELKAAIEKSPKLIYTVPQFQNPTGISYSLPVKKQILDAIKNKDIYLIEDNPYGELNYKQKTSDRFIDLNQNQVISLGSFSKIFAPSMRLGWVAAKTDIIEQLIMLKQAADLHTNYFCQSLLISYLKNQNINEHISRIKHSYQTRLKIMVDSLEEYMPVEVSYTKPDGGMFIWVTLPEYLDAFDILDKAKKNGVIFVPGSEFYIDGKGKNTMRLNFTNSTESEIREGINCLSNIIKEVL